MTRFSVLSYTHGPEDIEPTLDVGRQKTYQITKCVEKQLCYLHDGVCIHYYNNADLLQDAKCQHPGCGGRGTTTCSIVHLPPIITVVKEEGFNSPKQKLFEKFLPAAPDH